MPAAYHRGELAVQERARVGPRAARSLRAIRDTVPDIGAAFLARQPFLVLGARDAAGRLWATQLTGAPGFLHVPDPRTLLAAARPAPDDPLAAALAAPARTGLLAIEPAARRRMRLNGTARPDGTGLRVALDQVFSNCPKYIQRREPRFAGTAAPGDGRRTVTDGTALTPAQQRAVGAADTFFVATAADNGDADVSHRGGAPGFVRVLSPTTLRWPDYHGNAMFLTLGNLERNPAAGLLFPDWRAGTLLHLSGTARTDWDPDRAARVPGAERLVDFTVTAVREITAASPLRWTAPEFSPFNPPPPPPPAGR
ncbi:pyridoxamine 5'-phosphate oxidase family protein [Streptomyces sp. YIM 98790]|uniref:pyridoxamine 5'-phosphate oxidase family protein n=1 Tax=Streptomyces sp. YIM 98790 TaxID=2689077 RepID=UPI00140DDD64|nr:pyridoxamine 5'-phosphate oxidase family protein [Streptomyces sp. YIM 98790]